MARGMGFPLYVNGQLFQQPVTISHVPGPAESQGILKGMGVDPSMGAVGAYAVYRATPGLGHLADDTAPMVSPAPLNPETPVPAPAAPPPNTLPYGISPTVAFLAITADLLSTAGLIYHGYKRNQSWGWALVWGLVGGAFPIIAWPVALAQGYADKKPGLTPNRSRRLRRNGRRSRRRLRRNRRR